MNKNNQEYLEKISKEFNLELNELKSQKILSNYDVKRILMQKDVTKNAILKAKNDFDFNDRAKEKLMFNLLKDFESSIFETIDDAVARKGDFELLTHKLKRIDRKINLFILNENFSKIESQKIKIQMDILKKFIFRIMPEQNRIFKTQKFDIKKIVEEYELIIFEYMKSNISKNRLGN